MFYIEEKDRYYILKTDRYLGEDFNEYNRDLKSLYIFYDKKFEGWKIPKRSFEETYHYLIKKFNLDIDLRDVKLSLENSTIPSETKFKRKVNFNEENINVKLFNYQIEDVMFGLQRTRVFIASDPGVGKTIESISIVTQLLHENKIDGVFVVVKNSLTYHWKREFLEFSRLVSEHDIDIVTNENKKFFFSQPRNKIVICPNHLLSDIISFYKNGKLKDLWKKESLALIADECHEFKNSSAKRTKAILDIKDQFEYRILLSATPAINAFEDWYVQMKILDESIIPYNQKTFILDIAKSIGNKYNSWGINSYDKDKVKKYIDSFKPYVIKRIKAELPEMKTKQFIKPVYVNMTEKHKKIYDMIREAYLVKYQMDKNKKVSMRDIENKYPYLLMCLEDPTLLVNRVSEGKDEIFNPVSKLLSKWNYEDHGKIKYLDEYLYDIIKTHKQKVIVFDNHPLTLDNLAKRYSEYKPLIIHGGITEKGLERQKIVDAFNDRLSQNKVIFLNPQTGGTGLNLNKACKHTIFLSTPFDTTLLRQSLDRTHRISSTEDSIVNILSFGESLDEKIMNTNLKRSEFNDSTFKDDLNIESLLI